MAGDLHCHTKLSDSSMGIDDLIVLAQKRGIETIAITDRDCQAGTVRAKIIGERRGLTVIPGVEISAYDSKREIAAEIICYLSDSPDRLEGLCHRNTVSRKRACQLMTLKIAKKYPITPELVLKCATGSTAVFEQHIMHALFECGLTDKIYGDLYYELFSPESPSNVIHEAGGVAVLAHPSTDASVELLKDLIAADIDGVEVWNPDITPEQSELLIKIAEENGLLTVGGTEFRGMYSKHPISLGEYGTPEASVKALLTYKAKMKKRKAAESEK